MSDEPVPTLKWAPQNEVLKRFFDAVAKLKQSTRWADPEVKAAIARVEWRAHALKQAVYLACMQDRRVPEDEALNLRSRVEREAVYLENMAGRVHNGVILFQSALKPERTGKPRWYNFIAGRIRDEVEAKWAAKVDWRLEEKRRAIGMKY